MLRDAIAISIGSHRPVAALGSVLMRAGRVVEARAIYEEYRDQNPDIIWIERVLAAVDAGETVPPLVARCARGTGGGLARSRGRAAAAGWWGGRADLCAPCALPPRRPGLRPLPDRRDSRKCGAAGGRGGGLPFHPRRIGLRLGCTVARRRQLGRSRPAGRSGRDAQTHGGRAAGAHRRRYRPRRRVQEG